MAKSAIEQEIDAIKTITKALESLDSGAQQRALDYAVSHLGLTAPNTRTPPTPPSRSHTEVRQLDIRTLRDDKKPSSDIQMVALVGYYLSELAPKESRKDIFGTGEVEQCFKQAGHRLPRNLSYTLANAKDAGYLDSVGRA